MHMHMHECMHVKRTPKPTQIRVNTCVPHARASISNIARPTSAHARTLHQHACTYLFQVPLHFSVCVDSYCALHEAGLRALIHAFVQLLELRLHSASKGCRPACSRVMSRVSKLLVFDPSVICLSVCLSICLFSAHLFICHLSVYLSVICLSVRL
jgi:hypothetical protein